MNVGLQKGTGAAGSGALRFRLDAWLALPTHRQEVLRHLSARQLLRGQRPLGAFGYDLGLLSWSIPTTQGPTPLSERNVAQHLQAVS